jgi:hypothetical protein
MNTLLHRCMVASLHRLFDSAVRRSKALGVRCPLILGALLCPLFAHGQSFALDKAFARSISGQFIIYAAPQFSPLAVSPKVAADTNFVRLEPALLAVSAERIKDSLYRRLEFKPGAPWADLSRHPSGAVAG